MDEHYVTQIVLQQYRSFSSYSERETAAASHLSIGAIRHLRALGLIEGVETGGGLRYSEGEVIRLRRGRPVGTGRGGQPGGGEKSGSLLHRPRVPPHKFVARSEHAHTAG